MEPCSKSQEWILTSPRGNDSEPSQTVKRRWSTTGSPWTLPEYLPQNDSELRHNIGLTKGSLEPWKWPTVVSTKMRSYNMIYLSSLLGLPVCLFVCSFVCLFVCLLIFLDMFGSSWQYQHQLFFSIILRLADCILMSNKSHLILLWLKVILE